VRRKTEGFTLIEIAIAVFLMLLMLMLAVPSMNGVMADRRLRRSVDDLNKLVQQAQDRSVTERRAYLIAWEKNRLVLRPEAFKQGEDPQPVATLNLPRGEAYTLKLPAALTKQAAAEWVFWPTGTCEPATVGFKGPSGTWTANYSGFTARAQLSSYAAK
jgi:type II secretory pathway pseudopilin PulG